MTDRDDALFDALTARPAVLRRLCEGSAYKRDLVEEMERSRSTLDRAVRRLEAAGLVERTDDGVEATLAGRLAAEKLDRFQDSLADVADARAVLEPLSSDAPLDPAAVTGAEARLATDPAPFRALQRVHDELAGASRYRALLPALDDPRHVRLLYDHVVTDGRPAELVVSPDLFRTLRDEFPRQLSAMAGQAGFRLSVADDLPSFAVGLVERDGRAPTRDGSGAADATVTVVVFTDDGPVHGTLVNDAAAAVRWAERLLDDGHERATDRTDDLATTATGDGTGTDTDGGVRTAVARGQGPTRGWALPVELERAGFVRFDAEFVRDEPVSNPTTAWRTGLSLPEVHTGYAAPRFDDGEPLADRLIASLGAGDHRVLVGPPGAGKSTVCKRVACQWYDEGRGAVLYRTSDRGRSFDDVDALAAAVDAAAGHTLVVVEDAVRPGAAAVFDAVERLGDRPDVSFLLDAREREWADPPDGVAPGEGVTAVTLPRLDGPAVERVVDHFERTADVAVDVPVDRLLADLDRADDGAPGRMLLLLHRLATYADPLAETETSLEAAVAALVDDLAGDDVATDVAVLVAVLNAAGLGVDAGPLYAVVDPEGGGSGGGFDAVDAAIDRLTGPLLVDRADGGFRTVHEEWSTAFLAHLHERDGAAAGERFGRVVSSFLALADDSDRRAAVVGHADDWTLPDPKTWADETVAALYALARERPRLAPLFGDGERDTVVLPDACSDAVAERRPVWLGRAFLAAGDYDRAERAFERLPVDDGGASGDADGDGASLTVERRLGLSRVTEGRGDDVAAAAHARAALALVDDGVARGRAEMALGRAQFARDDFDAAGTRYRAALAAFEECGDRRRRADALNNLGTVAYRQGDFDRARERFEASRDRCRELGDRTGATDSLNNLGLVARQQGDLAAARGYHERALELERELGDRQGEAGSLGNLGTVAHMRGDYDRAREYHERSLELERELGNRRGQATSLVSLGIVASRRGNLERARERFEESLAIRRELDAPRATAKSHTELGLVAFQLGEFDTAREHLTEGLAVRRDLDLRHEVAVSLANLGLVACRRGAYGRARDRLEESLAIRRDLDDRRGVASGRSYLGRVARRRGNCEAAREQLTNAWETARELDDDALAARCRLQLGALAREQGAHGTAREHLTAALDAAEDADRRFEATERRLALGRLALADGDHERAAERARGARERFAAMGATDARGRAELLGGRAAARAGSVDAARDRLEAALAAFTDAGAAGDALVTLEHLADLAADDEAAERWRRRARELAADAPSDAVAVHGRWVDD